MANSQGSNHRCRLRVYIKNSVFRFSELTCISALVAYSEFARMGYDVRIFERDSVPGGNWHYTDELPLDSPVPNVNPLEADFRPHLPPENVSFPYEEEFHGVDPGVVDKERRGQRSPTPLWESVEATGPKVSRGSHGIWTQCQSLGLLHSKANRFASFLRFILTLLYPD